MRIIVPVALVIVVALAVFVQTRPDRFHIERSTTIEAPSAAIFPHINDFHRWTAWSPWERIASECPATEWATVEVRELGPCWERTD